MASVLLLIYTYLMHSNGCVTFHPLELRLVKLVQSVIKDGCNLYNVYCRMPGKWSLQQKHLSRHTDNMSEKLQSLNVALSPH